MAKIGRPAGTRKYSPKAFREACEAYFASISYTMPMTRRELILDEEGRPVLDEYGHAAYRFVPIITADGQEARETMWVEPPSIQGLCLHLGIDASTFSRYMKPDPDDAGSVRLAQTAATAKARVETYLISRLEEKGAANGVKFNLQHNFGWLEKKPEETQGSGSEAIRAAALQGLTMADKIQMLKDAGVDMSLWE